MSIRESVASREMRIAFPRHLAEQMLPLLQSESAELEAVFGAPVRFVDDVPSQGPRWIVVEQADLSANSLKWDSGDLTLTSFVRDAEGLGSTLQMLHSLVALEVTGLRDDSADDLPTAIARLGTEIRRGFPGFAIRNLHWEEIRAEFPADGEITLEGYQRLIARLQDGHTAVRAHGPVYNPPYAVELHADEAVFRRIAPWSAAARAGIEPGWRLEIENPQYWLDVTGSPPHSHALVAGRRAIALNGIEERVFSAVSPGGETREFIEVASPFTPEQLISHRVVAGNALFVRMHNWIDGVGIQQYLNRVIAEHAHLDMMVLDLRGNTGGNLVMAQQTRRLFLRERTLLGTVQFTRADGELAEPVELWDEPAESGCWPGRLVVLTDPLTYSASEDFLHGLQGLPHVTVIGRPSGGGSGRPRTLPIVPGWSLTMSTALTFDRNGHCIEGRGIPVDLEADPFTEDWQQLMAGIIATE